ncbi:DUF4422 domain-containing protein [Flavobacterium sp. SUN046]|uniref:DUF4422 domain-containing protein n=1 Tax=Flavobacterium sp. SUN046 TaxID=3002440 RepID=UPI002DB6B3E1|nr:DUF4422 domain-containing protein [Flavobacterium sp. SUN046]MEC4049901.1 DUF4422 domain-containing protein [Flavobacterium sp. SUN046]
MSLKIKILVATHKPVSAIENTIFQPIQVGTDLNPTTIKESYLVDNTGDSISEKNKTFNELTALYWAWKNFGDYDVFGLAHYRRFLDINYKVPFFKKEKKDIIKSVSISDASFLKLNDEKKLAKKITKFLNNFDVLVAKPAFCTINQEFASISDDYKHNHIASDWDTCMDVIIEKFPEYTNSIELYLNKSNRFYIANMFIAKKEWFISFSEWLFAILLEVEKRIVPSEDPYQRRVIGFLSERLFTLYILHHQFKLKELPILFVE